MNRRAIHRVGLIFSAFLFLRASVVEAGTVRTVDGQTHSGLVRLMPPGLVEVVPIKGATVRVALTNILSATFELPENHPLITAKFPNAGRGTGLVGAYYERPNFSGRAIYRVDETIDFNWGAREPVFDLPRDYFTVRWSGKIEAPSAGLYTFWLATDDGGRMQLGNDLKLEKWQKQESGETNGVVRLEAGQRYDLRVEYFDNVGNARVRLLWSGPGFAKSVVPRSQLYPTSSPDLPEAKLGATNGLLATYFKSRFFFGDAVLRVDPMVNFAWTNSPAGDVAAEDYSVRWTGQIEAKHSETYTFHVETDEGVRLWVNGKSLLNELFAVPRGELTGSLALEGGKRYELRMETMNRQGGCTARLYWSSTSTPKALIPSSQLFPGVTPPSFHRVIPAGDDEGEVQPAGVLTWGGSLLPAPIQTADDTVIRFGPTHSPPSISLVNVARLYLQPLASRTVEKIPAGRKGVLLANGDFVDGEFKGIEGGRVIISSVLFGLQAHPLPEVLAVAIRDAPRTPPVGVLLRVGLPSGALLHAKTLAVRNGAVIVEDPSVGTVMLPADDLRELKRVNAAPK